ncbi:MAG: ATP-binding protein [Candidatus Accumulibacter sp.]|nr:ATP-binding protein [Candidatus Accumulibacter conexus]
MPGDFNIVPASLAVKAMRDSGYKNAAYAIAELVDNAVQAGATTVEILCQEEEEFVQQRTRARLSHVAVLDNGRGMDVGELRRALQFGNGGRLNDRTGIGRFGMGLPNSSISQARRVDVWSWQRGRAHAIHSYLDVGEIERGQLRDVPEPQAREVPPVWAARSATARASMSGTLVLWSELDKCDWRTARSIFKNSEFTIGRVYRHYLQDAQLRIRMADFLNTATVPGVDDNVLGNDPLYLTSNPQLPSPWNGVPMFEAYGDPMPFKIWINGQEHTVSVRFSVAKKEARSGHNAGEQPHGKHAKNNVGVSIVRAKRELELQTGWCNQHDSRERWWGAEVDFPPALDEVFGVTNNKQSARSLAEFSTLGLDQIAEREGFNSEGELIDAWTDDRDPRLVLVRVKQSIESNLSVIRSTIKAQATPRASSARHHIDPNSAESIGTQATRRRIKEGYSGTSDAGEGLAPAQRETEIQEGLASAGVDEGDARERARVVVQSGQKYEFYKVAIETAEFFTVRPRGGSILIGLNTNHPAYDHLVTLLESSQQEEDVESLKRRLRQSFEGLKLLLEAWARYEDERPDGVMKERTQEARLDWGRVARQFFRED